MIVALDDGHGMQTAGKRTPTYPDGHFMHENEFNRAVICYLNQLVLAHGIRTVLTAPTDADTSLIQRVRTANEAKADIFISVHANALNGLWGKQQGIETYHYTGSTKGLALAKVVQKHIEKGTAQVSRGVKEAKFYVLKYTNMPAVLIEAGFMDNQYEAALLQSDEYRKETAKEIMQAICEWFSIPYIPDLLQPVNWYKVQVGAFVTEANAVRMKNKLAACGYSTKIVKDAKLFKVQVGAYNIKENAEKVVEALKEECITSVII